jgi:hypothetical protein
MNFLWHGPSGETKFASHGQDDCATELTYTHQFQWRMVITMNREGEDLGKHFHRQQADWSEKASRVPASVLNNTALALETRHVRVNGSLRLLLIQRIQTPRRCRSLLNR